MKVHKPGVKKTMRAPKLGTSAKMPKMGTKPKGTKGMGMKMASLFKTKTGSKI